MTGFVAILWQSLENIFRDISRSCMALPVAIATTAIKRRQAPDSLAASKTTPQQQTEDYKLTESKPF
jgi:hypothetical protein